MIEYDVFWFTAAIIVGTTFISLAIYFGLQIAFSDSEIIYNYKDCLTKLPNYICDIMYPPIKQQNV